MVHDVLAKLSIAQHAYGVDPTTANMGHSLPKTGRTVTTSGSATEHKHQGAANTDVVGGHCTIQKSNSLKNVDHAGARIGDTQRDTILTCHQIQTNANIILEQKTTFITKLINFITNIFFIEEEVSEEEDSQEGDEYGLTTSKNNPHQKF